MGATLYSKVEDALKVCKLCTPAEGVAATGEMPLVKEPPVLEYLQPQFSAKTNEEEEKIVDIPKISEELKATMIEEVPDIQCPEENQADHHMSNNKRCTIVKGAKPEPKPADLNEEKDPSPQTLQPARPSHDPMQRLQNARDDNRKKSWVKAKEHLYDEPEIKPRPSVRRLTFQMEVPDTSEFKSMKLAKGQYQGEYLENKRHGFGFMAFSNGALYEGWWKNDKPDGEGTLSWSQDHHYSGEWREGKMHGTGYLMLEDGSFYDGEWKQGVKHGFGREMVMGNLIYKGEYSEGKKVGEGIIAWDNGNYYSGNWADDKPNGKGKMKWESGEKYTGEFLNGIMHGFGICQLLEGQKYQGSYSYGSKCGQGTHWWSDVNYYDGEWENGKQHGKGVLYEEDGTQKRGKWSRGFYKTPKTTKRKKKDP